VLGSTDAWSTERTTLHRATSREDEGPFTRSTIQPPFCWTRSRGVRSFLAKFLLCATEHMNETVQIKPGHARRSHALSPGAAKPLATVDGEQGQ
jgi:hypothetical protein